MPLADILAEVARAALAVLVASLAIYLSLRLLGKIAKFVITLIVIALIVYFVFFATDIAQNVKNAVFRSRATNVIFRSGNNGNSVYPICISVFPMVSKSYSIVSELLIRSKRFLARQRAV